MPLSDDEAISLIDNFPENQPLKLTPLSDYSPFSYSARSYDYYKALLAQYPATSKYESKTAYTLYDIDKDDSPELFVRIDHSTYYVFTMSDSHLVFCGEFFWSYSDCLYEYDANGIIIHSGGTGYLHLEHLTLYTLSENNLEYSKTIISTEESTEEELYEKLRQLKKIDCTTHITDYSLFENRN